MKYQKMLLLLVAIVSLVWSQSVGQAVTVIKQASIRAYVVGPTVVEADKVYEMTLYVSNNGSSAIYSVSVDATSSAGVKIVNMEPTALGTLAAGQKGKITITLYILPTTVGYQTLTFHIVGYYPDGSMLMVNVTKGLLVKGPKTSPTIVKVLQPYLCVGKWNPLKVQIINEGKYPLKNVLVDVILKSCNGKTYTSNIACIVANSYYIPKVEPNSTAIAVPQVYVSPAVDTTYPLALTIKVTYVESGHLIPIRLNTIYVQSFTLVRCLS